MDELDELLTEHALGFDVGFAVQRCARSGS
jgi:hypothetical protein